MSSLDETPPPPPPTLAGTYGSSARRPVSRSAQLRAGRAWAFGGKMDLAADPQLRGPSVSVVIPARDEAANLPAVLASLPDDVFEIVLVDGASTDGTAEVARQCRPDIRVIEQVGRGKGDALLRGFAAARGDIIVMFDGDGSAKGDEIPRFVSALQEGADLAKGSRFTGDGGSADITLLRRLGNKFLRGTVNLLFDTSYTDLCYGFNAVWARCLPSLRLDCIGFEFETLLNIRAARAGLEVREVPSYEERRLHGASNLNAVRDGIKILRLILRERFARAQPVVSQSAPGDLASGLD
jgi:glycosyltransferase involved in cell wall biosynthesis